MHFLNQVQVNLIYNTNRNLLLCIETFTCRTYLYSATADRWWCHLPNRNVHVCATQIIPIPTRIRRSVRLRSDITGTELPLPIYWYHSKDSWMRYNVAADSFYIMKLCSRLFVLHCHFEPKFQREGVVPGEYFFGFYKTRYILLSNGANKVHRATRRRFDTIPACDGQTHGRTDGQTELL